MEKYNKLVTTIVVTDPVSKQKKTRNQTRQRSVLFPFTVSEKTNCPISDKLRAKFHFFMKCVSNTDANMISSGHKQYVNSILLS